MVPALCAALLSAWALIESTAVFRYLSNNHDEAVYLQQADALVHGHLFPAAPKHEAAAFLPWLSAHEGARFVSKYTPVYASIIGGAWRAFSNPRAGLALVAVGFVFAVWSLATAILPERRNAALSVAIITASPVVLVQSGTFLSYLMSAGLLAGAASAVVRGARTRRPWWLLLAGVLAGFAVFARPLDAVLFLAPFAVAFLLRRGVKLGGRVRDVLFVGVGAILPFGLLLAFNRAATGHPFESPFGLIDPHDRLGFGARRIYPYDPALQFTPSRGVLGVTRHLGLMSFWACGGLVLMGLAVWGLTRVWRQPFAIALGVSALTYPVGYAFFWGSYGATVFGAPRYLGPYYYLPMLLPLGILGAEGLMALVQSDRLLGAATSVGMVVLSILVVANATSFNLDMKADDMRLNAGLDRPFHDRELVFLPKIGGPRLLVPFGRATNAYGYTGRRVYALSRGPKADQRVIEEFPDRVPYILKVDGAYRATPRDTSLTSRLRRYRPAAPDE